MPVATPSPRKLAAILACGWIAFYLFHLLLVRDAIMQPGTHGKIALFCTLLIAWYRLVIKLAPPIRRFNLGRKLFLFFGLIITLTIFGKVMPVILREDRVWSELLRAPFVAFWLPVVMLWLAPAQDDGMHPAIPS